MMTGIPSLGVTLQVDAGQLVCQIVRFNQVVVGSVNSNRSHFEMALGDMPDINSNFNGLLKTMFTHRFRLEEYQNAFSLNDPGHIITVIEVEPWS